MSAKHILRLYLGMSLLWIVVSDALLYQFFRHSQEALTLVGTYKGALFVAVTTLTLGVLRREFKRNEAIQQALNESEARYRDLFEGNPLPMWIFHAQSFRFLEVNDAAIAHYGYTREEFLQMTILDIRPPEERVRFLNTHVDRGTPYRKAGEWIHQLKDGKQITVEINAHNINYNGECATLVVVYDTSERKRHEQERHEMEQLRLMMTSEVQLREWRDKFFNTMAHEVRTPLAVISASASMLQGYDDRLSPERRQEQYDKILRQVRRMSELTDDISGILRAKLPSNAFKEEPFDLLQVCQDVVSGTQDYVKAGQTCTFTTETGASFIVRGDVKLLTRALENIVRNAVKYTPEGGSIRVRLTQDAIRENCALIEVEDNGIGIPLKDLPLIFEEFKRASNVGSVEGTGLGLAITKQAIELHGGEVVVTSAVGQGTTFNVRLPLISPPAPHEAF
jgi:PAS domain S-box-containing protein